MVFLRVLLYIRCLISLLLCCFFFCIISIQIFVYFWLVFDFVHFLLGKNIAITRYWGCGILFRCIDTNMSADELFPIFTRFLMSDTFFSFSVFASKLYIAFSSDLVKLLCIHFVLVILVLLKLFLDLFLLLLFHCYFVLRSSGIPCPASNIITLFLLHWCSSTYFVFLYFSFLLFYENVKIPTNIISNITLILFLSKIIILNSIPFLLNFKATYSNGCF